MKNKKRTVTRADAEKMSVEELEEIIRVNERKLLQMLAESNMLQSKILMNNFDLFSVDSSDPKRHKG